MWSNGSGAKHAPWTQVEQAPWHGRCKSDADRHLTFLFSNAAGLYGRHMQGPINHSKTGETAQEASLRLSVSYCMRGLERTRVTFFPRVRTPCGHGAQVIVEGRESQSDGGENNTDHKQKNQQNTKPKGPQAASSPSCSLSSVLGETGETRKSV